MVSIVDKWNLGDPSFSSANFFNMTFTQKRIPQSIEEGRVEINDYTHLFSDLITQVINFTMWALFVPKMKVSLLNKHKKQKFWKKNLTRFVVVELITFIYKQHNFVWRNLEWGRILLLKKWKKSQQPCKLFNYFT